MPLSILSDGLLTVQTFADYDGAGGKPTIKHGTLEQLTPWCQKVNQLGQGIYYAVNETDGQGRRAANITRIRAYFCDVDGIPHERQKREMISIAFSAILAPSAIVETRNGLHLLWYAAAGQPIDEDEYRRTNEGIIKAFNADSNVKDIARVLRLPNFYHQKDPQNPFFIQLVYEDAKLLYTQAELRRAYPPPAKKPKPTYQSPSKFVASDESWGIVLEALRGWTPVDGIKHKVLMLALGVAVKFQISEQEAVHTITPIVASWNTRESPDSAVANRARWAFSQGGECTVSGLRAVGVDVPKLPNPNRDA